MTRYIVAEDDDDLLALVDEGSEFWSTFTASLDLPASVTAVDLFFKMNKANVVEALRANNLISNNYFSNDLVLFRGSAPTSEWIATLKRLFVDKSPRKREKRHRHG